MRTGTILVIRGGVEVTAIEPTGIPFGPPRKSAVSTTVPETEPVNRKTVVGNTAAVVFCGMVKATVRDPLENRTAGSSMGSTLFEMNVIVMEPDRSFGCEADSEIPIGSCCVGFTVSGTLSKDNEPSEAATTDIVNALLVFKFELSEASTVNVNVPVRVGVPLMPPELERISPSGKDPLVRVQV